MKPSIALSAALFAASAAGLLFAQDTPQAKTKSAVPLPGAVGADAGAQSPRVADAKGVEEAVTAFVKAFNAGDAKAIAALFTDNAEVTDEEGSLIIGRPAILAQFEEAFKARPGATIALKSEAIKFFTDDVAQEEGRATITPVGAHAEHSRYSVVYVKKDGKWLQATVRDEPDHKLTPHDHLMPLAWMIGEWVNETEGLVTHTTCAWSTDKNYLLRDFTVQYHGKPEMSGTQRIGWDPLTKHVKSWVFDSEGGYGEGMWSHEEGHWIVKATGVLPDGKTASATHHIRLKTKDAVQWQAVDRVVGGKPVSEVEEVTLVRKPPAPKPR